MNYVLLICKWVNETVVSPSWCNDIGINNILQLAGAYYWLLTVGEGLFDFYTSCHVNYVNLDICIEGGKRRGRGGLDHFSWKIKWPFMFHAIWNSHFTKWRRCSITCWNKESWGPEWWLASHSHASTRSLVLRHLLDNF